MAKTYDRKGLVLLCSSFSKDISPSYRIGWIAPGRFKDEVVRLKMATSLGTAILPQLAIAEFLESGGYDHHLRKIRRAYAQKVSQMAHAVVRYFPEGTRRDHARRAGSCCGCSCPSAINSLDLLPPRGAGRHHPGAGVHLLGHAQVQELHPPQRGLLVILRRKSPAAARGAGGGLISGDLPLCSA